MITKQEALDRAAEYDVLEEVSESLNKGLSPQEALSEWGLGWDDEEPRYDDQDLYRAEEIRIDSQDYELTCRFY